VIYKNATAAAAPVSHFQVIKYVMRADQSEKLASTMVCLQPEKDSLN
jgi:hypothetical protein